MGSAMGRVLFFLSESFRALRRSAAPSVAAIVTIVITTLLLGVLIPVLRASESSASNVSDQIGLRVFLYRDATQAQIDALQKKLDVVPHVTSATYCSPECAQKRLAENLQGDLKEGIQELNSNPLPPSFDLSLDNPDNLEAVRASLIPPNAAGKPTLEEFIHSHYGRSREIVDNGLTRHFGASDGSLLTGSAMLANAKRNLCSYELIGFTEDLPTFFTACCDRFGWSRPGQSFHARHNESRPGAI